MSKYDALGEVIKGKRSMARYLRKRAAADIAEADSCEREAVKLEKLLEPDTSDDYKRRRYLEKHYAG